MRLNGVPYFTRADAERMEERILAGATRAGFDPDDEIR